MFSVSRVRILIAAALALKASELLELMELPAPLEPSKEINKP